ncbi:hypothetical protein MMC09_000916 [Bachmanniomyces sp. S44760]|nr:hypothetical protein [Bachmanniomyces sp. S44760]
MQSIPQYSSHRHKRRFQPSITNYLVHSPKNDTLQAPDFILDEAISPKTTTSNLLQIPPYIQSSLLNVGMRVRKAVPEGYRREVMVSEKAAFHTGDLPSSLSQAQSQSQVQHHIMAAQARGRSNALSSNTASRRYRAKELIPYCGVLSVGGLASAYHGGNQKVFSDVFSDQEGEEDEEELPALTFDDDDDNGGYPLSQDSAASIETITTTSTTNGYMIPSQYSHYPSTSKSTAQITGKRRFEEDPDELNNIFNSSDWSSTCTKDLTNSNPIITFQNPLQTHNPAHSIPPNINTTERYSYNPLAFHPTSPPLPSQQTCSQTPLRAIAQPKSRSRIKQTVFQDQNGGIAGTQMQRESGDGGGIGSPWDHQECDMKDTDMDVEDFEEAGFLVERDLMLD